MRMARAELLLLFYFYRKHKNNAALDKNAGQHVPLKNILRQISSGHSGWRKLLQYIRWGMRREPDKNYVG